MRAVYCSDLFVKLQLHRSAVSILSVLDQEHHEERDDGRARVYGQLPGIVEPKYRAGNSPNCDDKHGGSTGGRVSCGTRGPLSKTVEQGIVIHSALLYSYPGFAHKSMAWW